MSVNNLVTVSNNKLHITYSMKNNGCSVAGMGGSVWGGTRAAAPRAGGGNAATNVSISNMRHI